MKKLGVGIKGYSGRTGQELKIMLRGHPNALITYEEGKDEIIGFFNNADLFFLALPAEESSKQVPALLMRDKKVIDLSGAYRLPKEQLEQWYKMKHEYPGVLEYAVYGLPEINRDKIKKANLVANPGCYSTSVILPLYPIKDFISEIKITSESGISGSGGYPVKDGKKVKYSEGRTHRHIPEIENMLNVYVKDFTAISDESRDSGIETIIETGLKERCDVVGRLESFYVNDKLVNVVTSSNLKQINKSNYCLIVVEQEDKNLKIISYIDNLRKGAATQAIQNMNLMYGFDELEGIRTG